LLFFVQLRRFALRVEWKREAVKERRGREEELEPENRPGVDVSSS
jgi:3'-phosphoadenosine 5'-phosphosulfate sulfotransferase